MRSKYLSGGRPQPEVITAKQCERASHIHCTDYDPPPESPPRPSSRVRCTRPYLSVSPWFFDVSSSVTRMCLPRSGRANTGRRVSGAAAAAARCSHNRRFWGQGGPVDLVGVGVDRGLQGRDLQHRKTASEALGRPPAHSGSVDFVKRSSAACLIAMSLTDRYGRVHGHPASLQ